VTGNAQEAEEIMQAAFLSLWERWERWDHVSSLNDPAGYLYRTAMNVFRKRYRRAKLAIRRTIAASPPPDPFEGIDEHQDQRSSEGSSPALLRPCDGPPLRRSDY
jgi:DNA-directed RNA polymerase specialized sigma24 family protein